MKNFKQIKLSHSVIIVFLLAVNCFLPMIVKADRPDVQWMRSGIYSYLAAADYSPDGQFLATVESSFPEVKIWRVSDGMLIRSIKIPPIRFGNDPKIKYLSDGQNILVKVFENSLYSVKLIRVSDGATIRTFGSDPVISTFGLMPDGTLAIGTGLNNSNTNAVKFFDFSTGAFIRAITSITYVNASGVTVNWGNITAVTAFSVSGQIGVSTPNNGGGYDGDIVDTQGRLIRYANGENGSSAAISFSPNGDLVNINSNVYRVSQLCYPTQSFCNPTPLINGSFGTVFSPDGQTIAATNSSNNVLNFYRTSDFSLIRSLPFKSPGQVVFSPDSQNIAFNSYFDATNLSTLRILRVSDGTVIHRLESHYNDIKNVLFSPDGQTALSLSNGFPESTLSNGFESVIRVWNAADGTLVRSIPTGVAGSWQSNRNLAFSPDGQLIFFKSDGQNIQVRNFSDGTLLRTINSLESSSIGFVLSPNGQFVAIWGNPSVSLYRVSDGVRVWRRDTALGLAAASLAFTPDSQSIFSQGSLLNSSNGQLIRTIPTAIAVYSISVSPDGQNVAFSGDGSPANTGTTEIHRISDGSLIRTFSQPGGRNNVAKFSPNNQQIAIAGDEPAIRFYNLTDGTLARLYDEEVAFIINGTPTARIQSLEFSPNGSRFAYGRYDATMVVAANPCLYSLSQSSLAVGAAGGSGSFNISTAAGCAWQAVSNSPWLTTSDSSNGNGTVNFTFSANTGTPRTGQISVGGETFTVNQAAPTYIISGGIRNQAGSGLSGVTITLSGTTSNTATTNSSGFYSFGGLTAGGNYTVTPSQVQNYAITPPSTTFNNLSANQTADFQATFCSAVLSPASPLTVGAAVTSLSVTVNIMSPCTWTAASNNNFLGIVSGASGTGTGQVNISVAANTGAARTGTLTIANQTYTINQAAGDIVCTYSLNPSTISVAAAAGNGTFSVTTQSGCSWTAQTNAAFLTTSANGNGNGIVNYSYTANTGGSRSGTITVGGQSFTLNQAAAPLINHKQSDFDGDGKADISVFRPSNGAWYLQQSTAGFTGMEFGQNGDKIVPADYDGDGKTDIAVYRNGTWYLQRSTAGFLGIAFGAATDIPVPADYDGDGKAEIAVFRPSNGTWYILNLVNNQFTGVQFGQMDDKPVAADYDGDGKADIAVFRPSTGAWYLNRSQLGFTGVAFGFSTDVPVPGDYDGDGKTDVAVFRPSNGVWYLQRSTAGFTGIAFGFGTDLPTPADYDGDGKTDIAVFRPSNGTWYLQQTTAGFTGVAFGQNGDKPIPNAFVP